MTQTPAPRGKAFALLVGAGILSSKLVGLVRERVFAHYLGNSTAAGAFRAALRIPNLLQNLFGEGVLSASFIPVYARLLGDGDEKTAGRVAGAVATFLMLVTSVLVLLGVLATPLITDIVAPGFEGEARELTIRIVRILFPGMGLLVLSAWCLGVLNSHRKFFLSYVAPVLWSLAMIVSMVLFSHRSKEDIAIALSWGTVVGSALQFGIQLPFVFRYAKFIRFNLDTKLAHVRTVFRNMGPVFVGRGVVQISAYIDGAIATLLGTAAVSALGYAQTLYLLPIGLFGMSIAAAELPEMSRVTGNEEEVFAKIRERLGRGLRQMSFFVIPSAAAFFLIGDRLVAALFQTGAFAAEDTRLVWYILIASTIGMLAATLGRLYNSTFYALHDTKTPLRIAIIRMTLTGLLGLLFAIPFREPLIEILAGVGVSIPRVPGGALAMGAVGITAASAIAAWLEYVLLRGALRKRIGPVPSDPMRMMKLWGAALTAGVVARLAVTYGAGPLGRLPLPSLTTAAIAAGIFGTLYVGLSLALRVPEASGLLNRLRRR